MQEIGAFEAKNKLGSLLDRVEQGEEIVITRHGKPVARLVPSQPIITKEQQEKARKALQQMRERAKKYNFGPFNWEEIKKDRDEGRP